MVAMVAMIARISAKDDAKARRFHLALSLSVVPTRTFCAEAATPDAKAVPTP